LRNRIAALRSTTGGATPWNPNANAAVWTLAVSGSTVYAGGSFTAIAGQLRNRVAAVDSTTGSATAWNPNASSDVFALAVSGSTVYAGGGFLSIGGQARKHLAALDAGTGHATRWNPAPGPLGTVSTIAVGPDGSVWVGGSFTGFPSVAQSGIARFAP